MNNIYIWGVTGVSILIATTTLFRLIRNPQVIFSEELTEADRAYAWRIVVFVLFPLLNFLAARAVIVATSLAGGYTGDFNFGLLWYHVLPEGLNSDRILALVLLAGPFVQCLFSLCLLPALAFRPHPFLCALILYNLAFILGLNLVADPIFALLHQGGLPWQIAFGFASKNEKIILASTVFFCDLIYFLVLKSDSTRLLFARLTRPNACQRLRTQQNITNPDNPKQVFLLACAYADAGLSGKSRELGKKLAQKYPHLLYAPILQALLLYRRHSYQKAGELFFKLADKPEVKGVLKASFLAASAASAFAQNDSEKALNLSERALEFDDRALVARLVKIDVYLRRGKREEAAQEILSCLGKGLNLEDSHKVPLDLDQLVLELARLEGGESKTLTNSIVPKA